MHAGRGVFSQVMEYLRMKPFRSCVQRYHGNRHIQSSICLEQSLSMAFAQLTLLPSVLEGGIVIPILGIGNGGRLRLGRNRGMGIHHGQIPT